jgi:hypothetical protein
MLASDTFTVVVPTANVSDVPVSVNWMVPPVNASRDCSM